MKPNKIAGIVATVVFHAALLLLLLLWGYPIPFPPPPEEGMLINFGNSDVGSGDAEPVQQLVPAPPVPTQAVYEEKTFATQDYEEAPAVVSKKSPKKKKEKLQETSIDPVETAPQAPPRTVNKNALFPGQSTQTSNVAKGEGEGGAVGNQGSLEGSVNATNRQGSSLGSYASLDGRALSGTLPKPAYEVQEDGQVIVKIRVDKTGRVVEAKVQMQGTSTTNSTLHRAAEEAALRAHFTAAADNAPAYQSGTIIYVFRLGQ
ncbi:cell envelope biogenesis protein TonB [Bacteroidia bacterium]|nr:cell envelope biogenesis protein TonB [Bacteroidia bacterium]